MSRIDTLMKQRALRLLAVVLLRSGCRAQAADPVIAGKVKGAVDNDTIDVVLARVPTPEIEGILVVAIAVGICRAAPALEPT